MHGAIFVGAVLAFAAGVLFGIADAFARAGTLGLPLPVGVLITLAVGLPLMLTASLALEGSLELPRSVILLYAVAGLLNFVMGRGMFYASMKTLGASSGSVAVSPAMILSALLSWAVLGEEPSANVWLSLVLVTLAVYLAGFKPSGLGVKRGSSVKGTLYGLSAAAVLATATVLVRYTASTHGRPLTGALVSYAAAFTVLLIYAAKRGYLVKLREERIRRDYVTYMIVAGLSVALAQLSRYKALSLIPVANAVMLISLFPLHTAYFSLLLKASMDKPTARHFLAGGLSAAAIALAYS